MRPIYQLSFLLVALLCYPAHKATAQVITVSFGNPPSLVDLVVTDFATINQTVTEVDLIGTAANMAAITFPVVDITGFLSVKLRAAVTDSVSEPNPNVYMLVELFDSSLNVLAFDTYSNLYGTTPTDVVLIPNTLLSSPTFDYTDLIAFQLTAGGLNIDPLHITLNQIEFIIPEASNLVPIFILIFALIAVQTALKRTSFRAVV